MKLVREGEWGQGEHGLAGVEDQAGPEILQTDSVPPGDGPRSVIRQPPGELESLATEGWALGRNDAAASQMPPGPDITSRG